MRKIFNFFAEARRERMKAYPDYYANISKKQDGASNDDLRDQLVNVDDLVSLRDIQRILKSLTHRKDFRLSDDDFLTYAEPVLLSLVKAIEKGTVACRVKPADHVFESGFVPCADVVGFLEQSFFPQMAIQGVEEEAVAIDPDFGHSKIGKWRQKFYDTFPLRTPSSPVYYEAKTVERDVDVKRMFLLALVHADKHRADRMAGIPFYDETRAQREEIQRQRKTVRRVYRGQEY